MPRRKMNAVERHEKQREKLMDNGEISEKKIVAEPSKKEIACEEGRKAGFNCVIENNVLYFLYTTFNYEFVRKAESWLTEHFGVEKTIKVENDEVVEEKIIKVLPFSVGFKKGTVRDYMSDYDKEEPNAEYGEGRY